ncbi:MAG: carboxypeptidase regulatory-like domain-containing protein, partial [Acidimicrobiia bacterium]|nr:carboxypeptidase regulatory-like domain-containing protein [Acidimicrobiia bacterium]
MNRFAVLVVSLVLAAVSVVTAAPAEGASTLRVPSQYPTIEAALDAAADGDEIVVAPGEYHEDLYVRKPVTVRSKAGAGATTIVLDEGLEISHGATFAGFTVRGYNGNFEPVSISDEGTVFSDNIVVDNVSFMSTISNRRATVERNILAGNQARYADISIGSGGTVANNLIVGLNRSMRGIDINANDVRDTIVVNNTIVNAGTAIRLDSGSTRANVDNNVMVDSLTSWQGYEPTTFRNNLIWNAPPMGYDWNPLSGTTVVADPGFADLPGWLAYSPAAGSPMVDAGRSVAAVGDALFGAKRKADGDGDGTKVVDIGAFEFGSDLGWITGTVTLDAVGVPIEGACATAYKAGGAVKGSAATDVDGSYVMGLPPGSYELEFTDCGTGNYLVEWYDDASSQATATPIGVPAGDVVTGIDVELTTTLTCNGLSPTILGSETDDTLVGTSGDDVVIALGGDDEVDTKGGDDVVCAGDGDDTITGGGGDDVLEGGPGKDVFISGSGADTYDG